MLILNKNDDGLARFSHLVDLALGAARKGGIKPESDPEDFSGAAFSAGRFETVSIEGRQESSWVNVPKFEI